VITQPGTEDGKNEPMLVVCELLAYLFTALHESSKDMLKRSVLQFYSDDEISGAKDSIWNAYSEEVLGKKMKRNNGERTIREKEVDDIAEAVSLIDNNKKQWDMVTFCAVDLKRIPKFSPEELDMTSVIERLSTLEKRMGDMRAVTGSHTAQLAGVVADVVDLRKAPVTPLHIPPPPMYSSIAGRRLPVPSSALQMPSLSLPGTLKPQIIPSSSSGANGVIGVPPVRETQPIMTSMPTESPRISSSSGARKKTHNWFNDGPPPSHEEVKKLYEDLPSGFRYPASFAKRLRVVGKGKQCDIKIQGAPTQRIMFVENVSKTTADKDMENFIKSLVPTEDFQRASVDAASRKSFKFKVLASDAVKLLDPDVWPEGIGCRLWQFRRRDQDSRVQNQASNR